ncbi:mesaconyl-c(4)-CoA hydratase [Favolaschia claudopus]|uniref:Mesaconyl-c(4)-CoA hydratase n=1 Tax=Favolaschia claudopus TaxID=2862362 RepID=A0AAW0BXS4_9AGAR
MTMSFRCSKTLHPIYNRRLYTSLHSSDARALDEWIAPPKQLVLSDSFTIERISDLYLTLPTRDGTKTVYNPPELSAPLPYGSHLTFFHPRNSESKLRADGTDADFCPPPPLTRRMWAGGRMTWNSRNPLRIGESAVSTSTVQSVEKKGFDKGTPMAFVKQRIEITASGQREPSVVEERSHVYIADTAVGSRVPRDVKGIPSKTDFSFTFTPSPITLFRFSALTFNGHHIHLDKDYAQSKEGYPERLVHGPLTALMLLETTMLHKPNAKLAQFDYRARNPVIVNQRMTINGVWNGDHRAFLWAVNDEGVVGMTGEVELGID